MKQSPADVSMMSSRQQSAFSFSRSINLHSRKVVLIAVLSIIGLQSLHVIIDLSGSSVADIEIDAAWAPIESSFGGSESPRQATAQTNNGTNPRKEIMAVGTATITQQNSTRKYEKPPKRFEASNYTTDLGPLPWTLPEPTPMRYKSSKEFMAHYIAAKRRNNIPLPWEQQDKYEGKNVTLPLPIIALNFPKSATTTLRSYFSCGGITGLHTHTQQGRIGICMMENQLADRPPMDGCNTHRPIIRPKYGRQYRGEVRPIDFISDIGNQGPPCYYPGVHDGSLENIVKHYPDATIMLVVRNATSWHASISQWGTIMPKWKNFCHFDGSMMGGGGDDNNMKYWRNMYSNAAYSMFGKRTSKEEYWINFYQAHMQKVREFAMEHLSLTYVEVELNDDLGTSLEKYTGVRSDCVLDCHPGPKWKALHNVRSECHPVGQNPAFLNAKPDVDKGEVGGGTDDVGGGDDTTDEDNKNEDSNE